MKKEIVDMFDEINKRVKITSIIEKTIYCVTFVFVVLLITDMISDQNKETVRCKAELRADYDFAFDIMAELNNNTRLNLSSLDLDVERGQFGITAKIDAPCVVIKEILNEV